jgi:hypothetical protein
LPLENIKLGVSLLFKPGQLVEFRIKNSEGFWRGFYFTDRDRLAEVVERLDRDPRVVSLYYVINPCKASLMRERAKCACKICSKGSGLLTANPTDEQVEQILSGPTQHLTGNDDVDSLNWMFIDCDTLRAAGFEHESSTGEEKAACKATAQQMLAFLAEKGWPQPLLGDSGNGFHILQSIKMMNTVDNIHLLVDCLKALAARFNGPAAEVDCAVFNAARLTRAYGTTTRKGTDAPERPYRHNRLIPPKSPVSAVALDQILALGSEVPLSSRRSDDMPELDENFDPEDWLEWYESQGAFRIEGEREANGKTVKVTDICLNAGHKHSGSGLTGFIVGDSFGYHCFSDDCEGVTIGTIFQLLREAVDEHGKPKYEEYPDPIFKNDGLEAVLEFAEVADEAEAEQEKVEETKKDEAMAEPPEPEPGKDPWKTGSEALDGLDIRANDLAAHILRVVVHHPEEVWQDGFLHYAKRIKEKLGFAPNAKAIKVARGEVGTQTLRLAAQETMRLLIKFTEANKRLPDKVTLKHFIDVSPDPEVRKHDYKDEVKAFVDALEDAPASTFDDTANAFMHTLDLRQEIRSAREAFNFFLLREEDVLAYRRGMRKHWNSSTAQDSRFEQGAWQERTDAIYADFEKNVLGVGDTRKFKLGFPTIDNSGMNIGLDGDCAICLCGPASNRKTTAALSLAMNFAITGKNGLFFAGEHQCMKVMKRLTLQLSHFFKNDVEIGALPGLSGWEGLNRTATADDLAKMKSLLLKLKAGEIVPGFIEPQNIDAVTKGDEDKVGALMAYAEATFMKYQWDFIIIDPLDTIMPPEDGKTRGGASNWKVCSSIVDRLFAFSRDAFGGRGCMVIVTAQFGSDARRDIERIQEKNAGAENYDDELESILKRDGLIQYFTTIGQRFDLCLGVATRTKDGEDGMIVRGRDREGGSFTSLNFRINRETNYMTEKPKQYQVVETPVGERTMAAAVNSFDEEL